MPAAHLDKFLRACGAVTQVTGQSNTFVTKKLWAVEGDPNSHGGGGLIPSKFVVFINHKPVITNEPNSASADALCGIAPGAHCAPSTAQGAMKTFAYGPGGEGPPYVSPIRDLVAADIEIDPPVLSVQGVANLFVKKWVIGSPSLGAAIFTGVGPASLVDTIWPVGSAPLGGNVAAAIHLFPVAFDLVVVAPELGTPTLGIVTTNLFAANLTVGSPVISVGGVADLFAAGLVVGSPVLGVSIVGFGPHIIIGSPVLGSPTLNATGTASATDTIYPIGSAAIGGIVEAAASPFAAANLAVGAPVLGTPSVGVTVNLSAAGLVVGSPVIGVPTFTASGAVASSNLTVGSPVLGVPTFSASGTVGPVSLTVGSPVLGVPTFNAISAVSPVSLTVGSPVLDAPVFSVVGISADIIYPIGAAPIGGRVT